MASQITRNKTNKNPPRFDLGLALDVWHLFVFVASPSPPYPPQQTKSNSPKRINTQPLWSDLKSHGMNKQKHSLFQSLGLALAIWHLFIFVTSPSHPSPLQQTKPSRNYSRGSAEAKPSISSTSPLQGPTPRPRSSTHVSARPILLDPALI